MNNKNKTHEYFKRNPEDWGILEFLNECELESFDLKIDSYTKCLESIVESEQGDRSERAQLLLDKYKKESKILCWNVDGNADPALDPLGTDELT
ncbi:8654_t:CDS:2, partial [Scutellospora calospora]